MRAAYLADIDAPLAGARNMAVDHALLEYAQNGGSPVLRLYRWLPACLSFGRNQPARDRYDRAAAQRMGIDIVRRPTGGMAVLHDRELTYAFCAPAGMLGGARATYVAVNRALVTGLRSLGVAAELAGQATGSRFGSVQACFAAPAYGEVVVGGRKLVGSAQRCERHTILQHGSILLDDDQASIARLSSHAMDITGRVTSVRATLGAHIDVNACADAIAAGFERMCGIRLAPARLPESVAARAAELESLYLSAEWTWRR